MSRQTDKYSATWPLNDVSTNSSGTPRRDRTPPPTPLQTRGENEQHILEEQVLLHLLEDKLPQKVTDEVRVQMRVQIRQQMRDVREQEESAKKKAREKWEGWFYPLAIGFALNFGIWLSTIYQLYNIDDYYNHRKKYETLAWVAVFGLSMLFALFILMGLKSLWFAQIKNRKTFDKPSPNWAAILNALLCFCLVVAYFRSNALQKYGEPEWSFKIQYNETVTLPAFALVGGYDDAAMANFLPGSEVSCNFPLYDSPCPNGAFNPSQETIHVNSTKFGDLQAYVFRPNELGSTLDSSTDLSDRLVLQVSVNYDHFILQQNYSDTAVQTPYLFAVLFDPRIDLGLALGCGLVSLTEIPALASNTFTVSAGNILDTLREISPTDTQPGCKDFYTKTLSMAGPSYTSFAYHLGSMAISDPTLCDTHLNSSAHCVSQIIIRYGSHVVNIMESKHGIEKTDILLSMGAIVGAVQFFAWFLGMFSL